MITRPGEHRRFPDDEKTRIIDQAQVPAQGMRRKGNRKLLRASARDTGTIEIEAGDVSVRIARGADVKAVTAVMAAQ